MNWQLDNIPDICHDDQKDKFTCTFTYTFFTSSLIWGTIGPQRMYGSKALYNSSLYGFLVGAVLPIPFIFSVDGASRSCDMSSHRYCYPAEWAGLQQTSVGSSLLSTLGTSSRSTWDVIISNGGRIIMLVSYLIPINLFSTWRQTHWHVELRSLLFSYSSHCSIMISTWTGGVIVSRLQLS